MRKIFALLLCMIILLAGCMNDNKTSPLDTKQPIEGDGDTITVYQLTREQYYFFLDSPGFDFLETNAMKYLYSTNEDDKTIIERQQATNASVITEHNKEGIYRISNTPIYSSLIEFWGSKTNVNTYLHDNHGKGSAENIAFLYTAGLPVCVWITTETDCYFVSIDEFLEDIEKDIHSDSYTYRFYEYQEFLNKMRVVDANLLVNGENSLFVKMHYDYVEIPIIALLEQLGADIRWNDENVAVTYNGKNATINTKERVIKYENGDERDMAQPGNASCFLVKEHELYLDDASASSMLNSFGIELVLDRDHCVVRVNA